MEDAYVANTDRITRPSCRSHLVRGYRLLEGGGLHHRRCWLEGGGLRLEAEDSIATIVNLKDDAYVHCAQPEGTLKIFEDLRVFNFDDLSVLNLKDLVVFSFADLRIFIFDDLRVLNFHDLRVFTIDDLWVLSLGDLWVLNSNESEFLSLMTCESLSWL